MGRVIAGVAGGVHLAPVPGAHTRPTTGRVKEALFSRLEAWGMLEDARVVDLFAGSGALGCEAASRGAAQVDLVESYAKAHRVANGNAQTINRALGGSVVSAHRSSVAVFLQRQVGPWDVVLADPPYPLSEVEITEFLSLLNGKLGQGAVVVLERSSRSPEPMWPDGMQRLAVSRYGETTVWFAEECNRV